MGEAIPLQEHVPLAPLTTLEVGGPARYFATAASSEEASRLARLASRLGLPIALLGGGSNTLVSEGGYPGLVLQITDSRCRILAREGESVTVEAGAGLEWDALVAWAVSRGLAGLERLSGIPGRVGASPIQNVGAYGQETAETLASIEAVDLSDGAAVRIPARACGFGYRWSRFKGDWQGRYAITSVTFQLRAAPPAPPRYAELDRRLGPDPNPGLEALRAAVLAVRGEKSMLWDPRDPNRRSAGSFFLNPVVGPETLARIQALQPDAPVPSHPAPGGRVKIPAAWLIEQAGFSRGFTRGPAGLSSRHVLALINRGGARAEHLLALAREIRAAVWDRSGVRLEPEPRLLGYRQTWDELLDDLPPAAPTGGGSSTPAKNGSLP